jgi:hypothetical protein
LNLRSKITIEKNCNEQEIKMMVIQKIQAGIWQHSAEWLPGYHEGFCNRHKANGKNVDTTVRIRVVNRRPSQNI